MKLWISTLIIGMATASFLYSDPARAQSSCAMEFSPSSSQSASAATASAISGTHRLSDIKEFSKISKRDIENSFLRKPGTQPDKTYVNNLVQAIHLFHSWINNSMFDRSLAPSTHPRVKEIWNRLSSAEKMLSEMHRISILGRDGKQLYWPGVFEAFQAQWKIKDIEQMKNVFRSEADYNAGLYRDLHREFAGSKEALHHSVKMDSSVFEDIQKYRHEILYKNVPRLIPSRHNLVAVRDIPEAAWPYYHAAKSGFSDYFYPAPIYLKTYMKALSQNLLDIRTLLQMPNPPREEILHKLIHHYHLGVIGHPFVRVNNSVLMAQFNTVLVSLGMKPLPHLYLDYVIRSLSSEDAKTYMMDKIRQYQN